MENSEMPLQEGSHDPRGCCEFSKGLQRESLAVKTRPTSRPSPTAKPSCQGVTNYVR